MSERSSNRTFRQRPRTLLWFESGSCNGESQAILGAEGPGKGGCNLLDFVEAEGVQLLWHPSLSAESPREVMDLIDRIVAGEQELTLLCIEGSIIHGPSGTGMYDSFEGRPKKEIIRALCNRAEYVLAMGSCATFGGIPAAAPNPTESTGLQFKADKPGGLLGPAWRSRGGLPVINLAGCPVDAATMIKTMWWTLQGLPLELDNLNRPFSVQPCLSDGVNRKCGFADKVGYSCFGCIGAKFPLSKPLFRHVAHEPNGKSVNDPNERACTNHSCHAPSGLYGLHLIRRPQAEQRVGIETPVPT